MNHRLYFDELEVGATWLSPKRPLTSQDVAQFAELTGDHDPLHLDPEYAAQTPFREPIVHGLLGMSILAGLSSESPNVHTVVFLGVHDWQFLRPLYVDDVVHVKTEVVELASNGRRRGRVRWKRQLINQRGEVAQEGIFETVVHKTPAAAKKCEAVSQASKE